VPRIVRALAGLVLAASACAGRPEAPGAPATSPDRLAELQALGYVDYASEPLAPQRAGVVLHDPARSQPGYDLYASRPLARADLIDGDGRVVRSWQGRGAGQWSRVRLLRSGDLVVVGSQQENPEGGRIDDSHRFLELRSFDDRVLWRRPLPVHHDVNLAPDGRLMALFSEDRRIAEIDPEAEIRDEGIVFVTRSGEVQERRLFVPMLQARPDLFSLQPVRRRRLGDRWLIDLLHANSIAFLDDPRLAARDPIYALGNVLVTMRHQDTVAILDWDAGRVVWAWGQGRIRGPHDASLLADGHILLFDNRLGEGWSRVIEIDPLSREVVWEWHASKPTDFYSASRGSAQRLSNGNTLIAESDRGHAFEVTPAGDVVWDFWNPNRDERGRPATIVRMIRYPAEWLDPLL
jgi:Arylsulfotransferase (ASST)